MPCFIAPSKTIMGNINFLKFVFSTCLPLSLYLPAHYPLHLLPQTFLILSVYLWFSGLIPSGLSYCSLRTDPLEAFLLPLKMQIPVGRPSTLSVPEAEPFGHRLLFSTFGLVADLTGQGYIPLYFCFRV